MASIQELNRNYQRVQGYHQRVLHEINTYQHMLDSGELSPDGKGNVAEQLILSKYRKSRTERWLKELRVEMMEK